MIVAEIGVQLMQIGKDSTPMTVAICDDNYNFCRILYSKIIDYFAKINKQCQCNIFSTPKGLLDATLSTTHVVFLDIDMPEINGIDVARRLRAKYPNIFIVFVTGWIEYAPAGYCVSAFRYLLKQRLDDELPQCIDDIRDKMAQSVEQIQLQGREYPFEVALNDIMFFEGSSYRMVQLHSIDGKVIECKGRLSELEALLCDKGFLRLQRSFIANMRYILAIKNYNAVLKDGTILKTSERNYSKICNEYLIWKGKQL